MKCGKCLSRKTKYINVLITQKRRACVGFRCVIMPFFFSSHAFAWVAGRGRNEGEIAGRPEAAMCWQQSLAMWREARSAHSAATKIV